MDDIQRRQKFEYEWNVHHNMLVTLVSNIDFIIIIIILILCQMTAQQIHQTMLSLDRINLVKMQNW